MSDIDVFDEVIARLRAGDETAAEEIFRRFAERLIPLARNRLDVRLRGKFDPEDVLQSVFRSFFLRQANGQFELHDWDGLWSLLVRITLRKCGRRMAAFWTDRRDVRREVGAGSSTASAGNEAGGCWEAIARDPTAEEVAILTETLEHLMMGLDDGQRQIVELRLQGFTVAEISRQVERSERSVHRSLALVRDGLKWLEGLV
jgi:RNA polymerase sigma-70 factor, ECF subfamily